MNKLLLVIAIVLMIAFSQQVNLKSKALNSLSMGATLKSKLKQIEGTSLGNMISSLAEVHMKVGGPIDELIQAITDLLEDLKEKEQTSDENFAAETTRHDNAVLDWSNKIAEQKGIWEDANTLLTVTLYPRRQELEEEITFLENAISENIATFNREEEERRVEHDLYVERRGENEGAIAALQEAIALVEQLRNEPSLIQIRKAKSSLQKLLKVTQKMPTYGPMVAVLVELSQNFSDQAAVTKVLQLLRELLDNANESLANFIAEEEAAASAWVSRSESLLAERQNLNDQLDTARANLNDTNNRIQFQEERRTTARSQWDNFQFSLDEENRLYEITVQNYNDLKAQFAHENEVIQQAIAICRQAKDQIRETTIEKWNA